MPAVDWIGSENAGVFLDVFDSGGLFPRVPAGRKSSPQGSFTKLPAVGFFESTAHEFRYREPPLFAKSNQHLHQGLVYVERSPMHALSLLLAIKRGQGLIASCVSV